MSTLAILGRGIYLPPSLRDWILLIAVLAITALALAKVADLPTALLGVGVGLVTYTIDKQPFLPATIAFVAVLALVLNVRARTDRPGVRALKEAVLIGGGFLFYVYGRSVFIGDASVAQRNAERILDLERRLHLMVEPALQRMVLDHESLLRVINGIYSWAYLPFVLGALFWLYLTDDGTFKLMRTALGISVLLALATIALFPVAPPRLVPSSDVIGTHALLGRGHGFVNPYAAIPSFHIGWTALAGYALFRSVRGRVRWLWCVGPVTLMMATVILTGNHYWVDGVVGTAFTLVPFLVLASGAVQVSACRSRYRRLITAAAGASRAVHASPWAHWSIASLSVLLLYLLGRQAVDPWFTHYWGYMVGQITATIVILIVLEGRYAAEGGLSWLTYAVVVVATWADTLGTAGHMYDRFAVYDKIIHFGGGVAITAVAADLICAQRRKRGLPQQLRRSLLIAMAISLTLNVGWEIYEYLGDRVFSTGRHAGRLDTTYDLICDTAGTLVAMLLMAHIEPRRFDRANRPVAAPQIGPRALAGMRRTATARRGAISRIQSALLACGFPVPVVFIGFLTWAASRAPGYDRVSGTVSDLAEQGRPNAIVMQVGILLCGALIALFAIGLAPLLPSLRAWITAGLLVTGLAAMLAGIFQDYAPGGPRNREGFLHNTFAITIIAGLVASMALLTQVGLHHRAWRSMVWPGLLGTIVVTASSVLFVWGPRAIEGLDQRVLVAAALAWLSILAWTARSIEARLYQKAGRPRTPGRRVLLPRLHRHMRSPSTG